MTAVEVSTGVGSAGGVSRSTVGATSRPRREREDAGGPFGTGRQLTVELGPFQLERGGRLARLTVAYRHDGVGPKEGPQIVVVHALTGSADAAGDWWAPLIGPGRALDTTRVGVLCANLLGGRYGTTGPTSIDPAAGQPYGRRFPQVTVRDQARAQWALLDALGVEELDLVTGGSLGGMVALELALHRPAAVATVLPIAAPAATGALALAWNHVQLELLDRLGLEGLDLARRLALTTYRSETDFDDRFGRREEADGRASIVSYLAHQGKKLVDRFDVDTYRILVGAIDSHDIGRGHDDAETALRSLAIAGTRLWGVGIERDILYGPNQVRALVGAARTAGVEVDYSEIASSKGHDAFLVEWDQLEQLLRPVLAGAARAATPTSWATAETASS